MKVQSDQPRHAVHDMRRDGASCTKIQRSTLPPDPHYSMRGQRDKKGSTGGANASGARKDETIPRGHAFMRHTSLKRLEKTACKTEASEEKFRLCAAAKRKRGMDIHKITRMLYTPYATVCDWLLRLHNGCLKRLSNKRRRGRKSKVGWKARRAMIRWLRNSPLRYGYASGTWQLRIILDMLRKKFGIECRGAQLVLHTG